MVHMIAAFQEEGNIPQSEDKARHVRQPCLHLASALP